MTFPFQEKKWQLLCLIFKHVTNVWRICWLFKIPAVIEKSSMATYWATNATISGSPWMCCVAISECWRMFLMWCIIFEDISGGHIQLIQGSRWNILWNRTLWYGGLALVHQHCIGDNWYHNSCWNEKVLCLCLAGLFKKVPWAYLLWYILQVYKKCKL